MAITTFSSRECDQDFARAKRATFKGPVFITARGRPAYVLLKIEDYRKLAGESKTLVEALGQPGVPEFEFNPPRLAWYSKSVNFS